MNKMCKNITLNKIIAVIFTIMAVYSITYSSTSYIENRSLRLDEAMFAQSILTRDINGILAGHFDYGQSGSLGYILIIKVLTSAFGSSEYVLRSISFVSYIFSILLGLLLVRNVFSYRYSSVALLLLSGCYPFVQYAVDFKPYSMDVMLSFMTILLYYRHLRGKLSFLSLMIVYAVMIWFSFGNMFVIAGVSLYHFIKALQKIFARQTSWKEVLLKLSPSVILLFSVSIDYFLWVKPTSEALTESANEYWRFLSFPLFPKSREDIVLMKKMFETLFVKTLPDRSYSFFLVLFVIGIIKNRKKEITQIFLLIVFFVICASAIGMYPIDLRLQLFIFGFYVIFISVALESIIRYARKDRYIMCFLAILCVLPIFSVTRHNIRDKASFYMWGEECRPLIDYYDKIQSNSKILYVFPIAGAQCAYYLDYPVIFKNHNDSLIEKDNVIWGSNYRIMKNKKPYEYNFLKNNKKLQENVSSITKYDIVYMVRVHDEGVVYEWLLDELRKYGKLSIEYEVNGSRLYKFEKNLN